MFIHFEISKLKSIQVPSRYLFFRGNMSTFQGQKNKNNNESNGVLLKEKNDKNTKAFLNKQSSTSF